MKVITGSARGIKLKSLPGMDTRPTAAVVKEAMMNMVQFEIEGAQVLDLFAGTGQLGIEALSRGAAHCTFIDNNSKCKALVCDNLEHAGLAEKADVFVADVTGWLQTHTVNAHIVFADPPYHCAYLMDILTALAAHVSGQGVLLVETAANETLPEQAAGLALQKTRRYGSKKVTLYRKL